MPSVWIPLVALVLWLLLLPGCYGQWGYGLASLGIVGLVCDSGRVVGSIGSIWQQRAGIVLYRVVVACMGLYGLVKLVLGYDNTSKYIYFIVFRITIE